MNSRRPVAKYYRTIPIALLLSGGSLLGSLNALADQNSPTPGTLIENQATAQFTDAADGTDGKIVSDKVTVTVAEVAGIAASNVGVIPSANGGAYRTNTVYFDFYVTNTGNDPTRLFVPGAPSVATIQGINLPGASIGALQVITYKDPGSAEVAITGGNVVPAGGAATGTNGLTLTAASGAPVLGSIPAGGYIKVRVPITVPLSAITGNTISVTLGNAVGQQDPAAAPGTNFTAGQIATNIPYVAGTNDLYTQDNPDANEVAQNAPNNGIREASTTLTTPVIDPPLVTISGTVWDDANGSGTTTFTNINPGNTEIGANTNNSTPALKAILVGSDGKVLDSQPVSPTTGAYSLSTLGVQSGVHVILVTSTTTYAVGDVAPTTGSLPPTWVGTTPLDYKGTPDSSFSIGITATTGKDFGIDRLPIANNVSTGPLATPSGTNTTVVPTLNGSDPEDGTAITKYRILTLPNATTQGTLYYSSVAVTQAQVTAGFDVTDPALFTFDPVDTATSMTFTYATVDKAMKESATAATATITYNAAPVTVSGTVWNDKNNSANDTFVGINDPGEAGTNAVFGTTTTFINALLVNTITGQVIGQQPVQPDGTYSFGSVPANTPVQVFLSATLPGLAANAPAAGDVPTGWLKTSPLQTVAFNTGLLASTKDFGIRQKAKLVLVKRITKINGLTTNPNDLTDLTTSTADTFNNVSNWPANYLVGKVNAGLVKPTDTIEYTVYFLNNQGADASKVKICDPIRGTQTYVPNSLKLNLSATGVAASDVPLTDAIDNLDRANNYLANGAPGGCNAGAASSTDPGVAVGITGTGQTVQADKTVVPGATVVPSPTVPATPGSYGLFRFTTQVKP